MALINDIATARKYVRINFNVNEATLADITAAEWRFLVPILGQDLYETLLAEVTEDGSDYADLIEKCRRVVGPLAYWMDIGFLQTQITDSGIKTQSNDNMQAAHRWEFDELREALADKGCMAIEQLLQHLFQNKTYYDWTVPDNYDIIFQDAQDFAKYFPLKDQPFRIFESLRVLIRQAEDQFIRPLIGDTFFEYLRDLLKNNNDNDDTIEDTGDDAPALSAQNAKAISLIKKAVANLTIKMAIETLPVKIGSNGFTVILGRAEDRSFEGEQNADAGSMLLLYNSVDATGNNYLQQLFSYVNSIASDTVFPIFFSSSYYVLPIAPVLDDNGFAATPNTLRTGIFGF